MTDGTNKVTAQALQILKEKLREKLLYISGSSIE